MLEAQAVLRPARDRILRAAERVVAEIGAARLTLDVVAHAAGMSKGGLLHQFPSKRSLLGALAQRCVQSMERCIEVAKSGIGDQVTGVTVDIDAGESINRSCMDALPEHLGPLERFARLKAPQPEASEEFEIARSGGYVSLSRTFSSPQAIRLSFSWLGPASEQREDTCAAGRHRAGARARMRTGPNPYPFCETL